MAASETGQRNVVGAIIFFGYILAALFFTGYIARDLVILYSKALNTDRAKGRRSLNAGAKRAKAHKFAFLALVSFVTLSYHMLSFLIQSYAGWQSLYSPPIFVPAAGQTARRDDQRFPTPALIWTWATESTLFQDFAQAIVGSDARFWWTLQVLLYSLGWNLYMAVAGVKHRIPHLWAYFVIDQILPVSFTQNLFCTAVFLANETAQNARLVAAAPIHQILVVSFYLLALSAIQEKLGISQLLVLVFSVRVLLFIPFWVLKPVARRLTTVPIQGSDSELYWKYKYSALGLIAGSLVLLINQYQFAAPLLDSVGLVKQDSAVAALTYDYLLAILSLVVFIMT